MSKERCGVTFKTEMCGVTFKVVYTMRLPKDISDEEVKTLVLKEAKKNKDNIRFAKYMITKVERYGH